MWIFMRKHIRVNLDSEMKKAFYQWIDRSGINYQLSINELINNFHP